VQVFVDVAVAVLADGIAMKKNRKGSEGTARKAQGKKDSTPKGLDMLTPVVDGEETIDYSLSFSRQAISRRGH